MGREKGGEEGREEEITQEHAELLAKGGVGGRVRVRVGHRTVRASRWRGLWRRLGAHPYPRDNIADGGIA